MNNFVKLIVSGCVLTRLVSDALTEWVAVQGGPFTEALAGLRDDFIQAAQEEGLPEHMEQVNESWEDTQAAVRQLGKGIRKVFAGAEEEV